MKNLMEKHTIIQLKYQGMSNREIAKAMNIDRKTVARYWKKHEEVINKVIEGVSDISMLQESIATAPKYNSSGRKANKYTDKIDKLLDEILAEEKEKDAILGPHKQKLTHEQIYDKIIAAGHDIGKSTISKKIKEKQDKVKECFIRQDYDYGNRLEYDFGEVKLVINDQRAKYYMAVFSSPAGDFRWAYLYKNQKQDAFTDSHIKFFDKIGVYVEVVYDNMKNVVSKFIGRNEKELNQNLLLLANYYGYKINVTNCFKGNEKGHVESSVKIIRNKVFAEKYSFSSFEEACEYLQARLTEHNKNSKIDEEIKHLPKKKPKLEIGKITLQKVNSYSFVRIEKNFYSVPDYLVGCEITARTYVDKICIYSNNQLVCTHKKVDGINEISIDIKHYLSTLTRKPGALKNSLALKSIPKLKSIYDKHFSTNPRRFIEVLVENKEKSIEDLIKIFESYDFLSDNIIPIDSLPSQETIDKKAKQQIEKYNRLCVAFNKEVGNHGN